MLDDAIVQGGGKLIDQGVLGIVVLMLMALAVYLERRNVKLKQESDAEIERLHAAHEKTRDALLAEARTSGEALLLVKEQLRATSESNLKLTRMIEDTVVQQLRKGIRRA